LACSEAAGFARLSAFGEHPDRSGQGALRSLFELAGADTSKPLDLYFGPEEPDGPTGRWIKTVSGKGWFVFSASTVPRSKPLTAPSS
jgi:hypothetical protein